MKFVHLFFTWAGILGLAWILTSCAFTNTMTETIENTSDASTDFTSSTSPRADHRASSRARAVAFADANFARLRAEMAVGNGEHLASLGFLLGVPEKHQQDSPFAHFFRSSKNFISYCIYRDYEIAPKSTGNEPGNTFHTTERRATKLL